MDDTTHSEIINIKYHIAGEAIGHAERNVIDLTLKNAKKC